ncbi:MAG: S8 family serine peptidase [Desulfobacterales bacterium]|nr:MAG: S8 family serine peptidase [Desulfobacterales bacterium]
MVKFKPRVSLKASSAAHARVGSRVNKCFTKTGVHLVKLKAGLTTTKAVDLYKANPDVAYAEPNYKRRPLDLFPNDLDFSELWGLHNTGQMGGTPDADIDAPEAWQVTTGSNGVIVALIDSGVDYDHEDLSDNMWTNDAEVNGSPGVDDDGNGYVDDVHGIDAYSDDTDPMEEDNHGTHCAGTIGAVGNNGIGVVGVAWNVKIMALRFLGISGGWTSDAIDCLEYAIMMKEDFGHNVRVVNASFGGADYSQAEYEAILAAAYADILFVASAGNDSQDNDVHPCYPSGYDLPNIISVAATDRHDSLLYFNDPLFTGSNWGETTVDVTAPGQAILSCKRGNWYGYMSGTSMAASYVSGLAALILAANPAYSWDQVNFNILFTVDPLASLDGLVLTGGRINANTALTCTPDQLHLYLLKPSSGFSVPKGKPAVVKVLAGTCAGPAADASVTVDFDNGDPSMVLHDDGIDPDLVAGDGQYAGSWTPQVAGPVTITATTSAPPAYEDVSRDLVGEVASGPVIEKFRGLKEPGTILRIIGQNFGDNQGDSVLHINRMTFDSTSNRIKTWTDTKIRIRLPFVNKACEWFIHGKGTCRKRKVWVTVGGGDSSIKTLRVKKPVTLCP